MTDLREQVEALLAEPSKPPYWDHADLNDAYYRGLAHARNAMRSLIPKRAAVVTEKTLATALVAVVARGEGVHTSWESMAAAIMQQLQKADG